MKTQTDNTNTVVESLEVKNRLLIQSHELLINGIEQIMVAMEKADKSGMSMDYTYWLYATGKIINNAKNITK